MTADVQKLIFDLVRAHDFDGARRLLAEKEKVPWCQELNAGGVCYGTDKNGPKRVADIIKYTEICFHAQTMAQVNRSAFTRESAIAFLKIYDDGNRCQKSKTLEIENKKLEDLAQNLIAEKETLPMEEKSCYAKARNKCFAGGNYSYWAETTPSQVHQAQGGNAALLLRGRLFPKGSFAELSKCEEARLLDKTALTDEKHTGCVSLHKGPELKAPISTLKFMYKHASGGTIDSELSFVSADQCERVRKNGLKGSSENEETVPEFINPAGSSLIPRFIGECLTKQFVVCSPNTSEVHSPKSELIPQDD